LKSIRRELERRGSVGEIVGYSERGEASTDSSSDSERGESENDWEELRRMRQELLRKRGSEEQGPVGSGTGRTGAATRAVTDESISSKCIKEWGERQPNGELGKEAAAARQGAHIG